MKSPSPLVVAVVLASGLLPDAAAETLVVTNGNDHGPGSLRDAIAIAEANGEADEIVFADNFTVTLDQRIGDPVYSEISIIGNGYAQTTVDCSGVVGSFDAVLEVWAPGSLTLSGLTVQNSNHRTAISSHRGRLTVKSCRFKDNGGRALSVDQTVVGDVVVVDSLFIGNAADGIGGAISSIGGRLEVERCAFIDNNSPAAFYGGGAIAASFGLAHVIVRNSTFSGNHADTRGGAIHLYGGATVTLDNVTLAGNTAGEEGDDIFTEGSTVRLGNTIISGGCGSIWGGVFISLGHNLERGDTCGLDFGLGDMVLTDPLLGPLEDNGGPTPTHALLVGSPAIDAAESACAVADDQRGMPRPVDGDGDGMAACDIGAFERQSVIFHDGFESGDTTEWSSTTDRNRHEQATGPP